MKKILNLMFLISTLVATNESSGLLSFSYDKFRLSNFLLFFDNDSLEHLNNKHPLTDIIKQQVIIYDLFSIVFLYSENMNNYDFKKHHNDIIEGLESKNSDHEFSETYNSILRNLFTDLNVLKKEISLITDIFHFNCSAKDERTKMIFTQKFFNYEHFDQKFVGYNFLWSKNSLLSMLGYSKNSLFSAIYDIILKSLKDTRKVCFRSKCVSELSYQNLANFCLFRYIQAIYEISDSLTSNSHDENSYLN